MCEAREEYGVPDCEGNPASLDCPTCKAFKGVGICSHVLAINHILKRFNVRYQLATIGKKTDKKNKGPSKKNTPALERIPQREPDEEPFFSSSGGAGQVKKVKAGKEGAGTRILGVFSAYIVARTREVSVQHS